MRPLSSRELLDVWEECLDQSPVERAILLLRAACQNDPGLLAVGERDARLLTLREWTFGSAVAALAACPECGDSQELNFQISDVRADAASRSAPLRLSRDGYDVEFRPPNSLDLRALESGGCVANLLDCCVMHATRDGEAVAPSQLPAEIVSAVSESMSEADPQSEIRLAVACSNCGHRWSATFDALSFFWSEIQGWAGRLLNEVHQLAAAYGWSESDIVALSPLRRHLYLNLVAE